MIPQVQMASYDNPLRVVDSADFDGTNDYMLRGASLTGAADSKSGILSFWIRLDGGDFSTLYVIDSFDALFFVQRAPDDTIDIVGKSSAGSDVVRLITVATYAAGATWRHVLASWDVSTAGARSIYVNDVSDFSVSAFVNGTIDYTTTNWSVGAQVNGSNKFNGCIADLYFAPGQYLDFSLPYNRRKFISATGKPVHLGTTGSLPTGTAPLIYQHIDDGEAVANFATNRGTGGNFTITGTLDTGTTSPSD